MSRTFTYLFVNRLWLLFPKSIDFKDKNYIYLGIAVIKIKRAHKNWKFVKKKNKVYYTPPGHCSGQNWLSPLPTNVTTLRLTAMLCKLGKRIWNLLKEKKEKNKMCVQHKTFLPGRWYNHLQVSQSTISRIRLDCKQFLKFVPRAQKIAG